MTWTIERLAVQYDRAGFTCGVESLDRYLKENARRDMAANFSVCYCAAHPESSKILGYYTLAAASLDTAFMSASLKRRLPRYPVAPAALIGRLGVALDQQGKGLGRRLLADAIGRVSRLDAGAFAVLVVPIDEAASRWYSRFGFGPVPGTSRLVLPLTDWPV